MNRRREYPEDVGILLLDAYFPKKYIDQGELETYLGVSGKAKKEEKSKRSVLCTKRGMTRRTKINFKFSRVFMSARLLY